MNKNLVNGLKVSIGIAFFLCILSLILPWSIYSIPNSNGKLDVYNWGAHSINYDFFNQSDFVNDDWVIFLGIPDFSRMLGGVDKPVIRASWGVGMINLPLMIFALICIFVAFNFLGKKTDFFTIFTAIILIISLLLFFIFIQFGLSSLMLHKGIQNAEFSIGWGFIFVIISTIFMFVVYFLQHYIKKYEPMKKDIEE